MEKNYARGIRNEEEVNEEEFQEELNQNNKDINHEGINGQEEEIEEEDDDRLTYTLITLDLGNLIHIFEDNNISFIDMLLLSKEDLIELQLEIFQRNRILNFSHLFTKYAKNYSIREISDFFTFNKQFIFNSSIYDKVFTNNMNMYQNDMNNNYSNMDNNNYDNPNQDINYINTNPNLKDNQDVNILNQSLPNNQKMINNNNSNIKLKNKTASPKMVETQSKLQNINGGSKKNKNISKNSSNINNNDLNQDNIPNKYLELIKNKKNQKSQNNAQKMPKGNKISMKLNEMDKNMEYQKIIEKITILENNEMNYDLYTRLNLIKNYINNKGDKISIQDIININNDVDSMIEIINNNINYKNEIGLINNEFNKRNKKVKVIKK